MGLRLITFFMVKSFFIFMESMCLQRLSRKELDMKKIVGVILIMLLVINSCVSQNKPAVRDNMNKYITEWAEIEQLRQQGLPQSMFPKVDSIYKAALAENNYEQVIKAIIFQINNMGILKENDEGANNIFNNLKKDAEQLPQPAKSIVYSMIGQMYEEYYNQNAWTINQRTSAAIDLEDIHTWDARRLAEEAIRYYERSIQEPKVLQNESVDNYKEILNNGYISDYQPALYDLLVNRALTYYASDFNVHSLPQQAFVISNPDYFKDARKFTKLNIQPVDSLSPAYLSLKAYQNLLRYHLDQSGHDALFAKANADITALIDVDLRRMAYLRDKGRYADNDKLYENALIEMSKAYKSYDQNARVLFQLGDYYFQKGLAWRNSKKSEEKSGYTIAYDICTQIGKEYPGQLESNVGTLKKQIQLSELEIKFEDIQLPDQPFLALLKFRNIETLHQTIYPLSEKEALDYMYNVGRYVNDKMYELPDFIKNIKQKPIQKQIKLPVQSDFQYYTTEISMDKRDQGFYLILMSDSVEPLKQSTVYTTSLLQVSSLMAQDRSINQVMTVSVTDRKTGSPLSGAKITAYRENKMQASFATGENGIGKSAKQSEYNYNQYYTVKYKEDQLIVFNPQYDRRIYNHDNYNRAVLFTDRSIYRPGQIVYFKAILYNQQNGKKDIVKNRSVNVQFRDVNWQVISEQALTSNDFGSIEGNFTIPQGLLNGQMTIDVGYGSTYIQVEEYKRPTFEVKFDPVAGNFALNEEVQVTANAKALAGYTVDNADVQYRVTRSTRYRYYRWWLPSISDNREISSGVLKTDDQGNVSIEFTALADDVKDDQMIYTYTVTADVTDINGETRSATVNVQVSNKPLLVNTNLPEQIQLGKPEKYTIETTNLNGDPTPASVQVELIALRGPKSILRKRIWQNERIDLLTLSEDEFRKDFPFDAYNNELNPDQFSEEKIVAKYKLDTEKEKELDLSSLKQPGYYKIKLTADNKKGVTLEDICYVYLLGDKPEVIGSMDNWLTVIKDTGEPGEQVEFWIAGAEKESHVYCELIHKDRIIESKWIKTGTTPTKIIYPIKEEYRGSFALQFSMIQNNRIYTTSRQIIVPFTNKMLDVKLATFRDKLLPGENETWSMLISNKKGEKEVAEIVASLYDASLDAFRPHNWTDFSGIYNQYIDMYTYQWGNRAIEHLSYPRTYWNVSPGSWQYTINYANINWFDGTYRNAFYANSAAYYGAGQFTRMKSMAVTGSIVQDQSEMLEKESEADFAPPSPAASEKKADVNKIQQVGKPQEGGQTPEVDLTAVETRTNFNETAFFYPVLRTNEKGEVLIEFTIPEALTRWKLLSFAHTKDFKIGTYQNELITQKQVAITANPPRFFRENDVIEFTAKVNNLTETDLNGQAMLQLFDAVTMQPIDVVVKSEKTQRFSVKTEGSAGVSWQLSIPEGIQAITYKVTAQAGTHTDGEEKTVPVLTNSMLVTETMPFSIRAGQERTFTFDRLINNKSKTLRNHSLTLEFTSAPAWYAVQSLPYIMEYPYECAEQTFSRYYANTLATTIVNKTPRIKQVFDAWNTLNSDALMSNLEKNQELKQVMLEETPWVMQAKNETERKKRIGLLFDLNRMSNEMNRAFNKLKKVQNSDGGFPWFQGNPSSRYITQHIVAGMAHLEKLGAMQKNNSNEAAIIVQSGLSYLDACIWEDYDRLIRNKADMKKQQISSIQLHYLYACSFSNHKPNGKRLDAFNFYLDQTSEYWKSFSTYEKAIAALVLHRNDKTDKAMQIIRSLKEYAQQSEEMGMYWKDNVAGYFWYQAPIETQAMLIEAFNEVAKDETSVEEMKIWLLRNKQTNDWKTTKATSEAIYALLMTGSKLLDESKLLEIEIANKPLKEVAKEDIKPEAGTGYVKTSWQGSDITPQMGSLKVTNPNQKGIAWGGMYWQYFEQLDKITAAETNLKMNKQLFLRTLTGKGEELQPINEKNKLKVGDLVRVRMELRADRDYEYVHLKDMRASGFEPVSTVSGHRYQDGLWYYESVKDASTNFFITYLRKGTYVFEYDLRVSHMGDFSNGITTFQCMYAPEFSAHSEGIRVMVGK